jgi:hypothetical protein
MENSKVLSCTGRRQAPPEELDSTNIPDRMFTLADYLSFSLSNKVNNPHTSYYVLRFCLKFASNSFHVTQTFMRNIQENIPGIYLA